MAQSFTSITVGEESGTSQRSPGVAELLKPQDREQRMLLGICVSQLVISWELISCPEPFEFQHTQ